MNNYNVFDDISQVPTRSKTLVVTSDEYDRTTLIFTPMWRGNQAGEERTFGAADVDFDPLASIEPNTPVYVQGDTEELYKYAEKFSEIFKANNGNLEGICDALDELSEEEALQRQLENDESDGFFNI